AVSARSGIRLHAQRRLVVLPRGIMVSPCPLCRFGMNRRIIIVRRVGSTEISDTLAPLSGLARRERLGVREFSGSGKGGKRQRTGVAREEREEGNSWGKPGFANRES